ncbi:hypothetical protein [Acinetobacter sp. CWB-B33]|uniref:hypothetical protein n=1 Tax=Acinetobacter sp. CWB-B33 TaxID=2815724 RepID=UPI0031FE8F63
MGMQQPQSNAAKTSKKKAIILMALGLLIPIFLVTMAILAVNSDAKNQEKYAQQKAEMLKRIEAREAAERAKAAQEQSEPAPDENLKNKQQNDAAQQQ